MRKRKNALPADELYMEPIKLGQLINAGVDARRDAVHTAIAPVVAAQVLLPGAHINLIGNEAYPAPRSFLGIVDPFLTEPVIKGERFWMLLPPGSITSLRHAWEHPCLGSEVSDPPSDPPISVEEATARTWIRTFAVSAGLTYDALLAGAEAYLEYGDYLCQGDRWEGFYVPNEFWIHYGVLFPDRPVHQSGNFFSCAC